jgi:hypothetical protein
VVNEPTLSWSLAADRAGRQNFDLGYATAGLAWQAEYRVDARGLGNDCRMSLEGAAMVVNRSGADFKDVQPDPGRRRAEPYASRPRTGNAHGEGECARRQ